MNRRDFFRGVGAAAAALALEPVPEALAPAGSWVLYGVDPGMGPGCTVIATFQSDGLLVRLLRIQQQLELLKRFAERDREIFSARPTLEQLMREREA